MLQQGHFVADVLYFYGEDSNITALFANKGPEVPPGYNFDYLNADALVHLLSVEDGELTTPSGLHYRLLALDPYSQHMSVPVLRKIRDLVAAGAAVAGPKPVSTPSLSDDKSEFHQIAEQLWGTGSGEHSYGKGKVYTDQSLSKVLTALHVDPDFEYGKPEGNTHLLFVHRRLANGDLYLWTTEAIGLKTWTPRSELKESKPNCGMPIPARSSRLPLAWPRTGLPCRYIWNLGAPYSSFFARRPPCHPVLCQS